MEKSKIERFIPEGAGGGVKLKGRKAVWQERGAQSVEGVRYEPIFIALRKANKRMILLGFILFVNTIFQRGLEVERR